MVSELGGDAWKSVLFHKTPKYLVDMYLLLSNRLSSDLQSYIIMSDA